MTNLNRLDIGIIVACATCIVIGTLFIGVLQGKVSNIEQQVTQMNSKLLDTESQRFQSEQRIQQVAINAQKTLNDQKEQLLKEIQEETNRKQNALDDKIQEANRAIQDSIRNITEPQVRTVLAELFKLQNEISKQKQSIRDEGEKATQQIASAAKLKQEDIISSTSISNKNLEDGICYLENDYNRIEGVESMEECGSRCNKEPICKLWTYSKNTKVCWLKNSIPSDKKNDKNCVSSINKRTWPSKRAEINRETDLNIRSNPGRESQEIIGTIKFGDQFVTIGDSLEKNGQKWIVVEWKGIRGWVNSNFLSIEKEK